MPYDRPDLKTLIERATADIESRLTGADARLRRSNLNVMARMHGGGMHGLYGYVTWLAKQILPDQADEDMLVRHASIWLENGRIPASYAVGQVLAFGTDGAVIEADEVWKRADGALYATESEVSIVGGQALVTLVAVAEGQAGNAPAGITLTLDSPIVGVNATAAVTSGALTGGADIEDIEVLRTRLMDRIKKGEKVGSNVDYEDWAKEVPGVTRAWCFPGEMGDGTVTLRFVRDDDASLIPDINEVAAVQAYIDALRPVTSHLFVVAPIADPQVFQIQLTPATVAAKAAVEANLRDMLLREAEPEGGAGEGRVLLSHLREAISLATGETDHVLVSPVADITPTTGHMVTFGSITWL
jgi:uncharacterized phage protein gp47/JayE